MLVVNEQGHYLLLALYAMSVMKLPWHRAWEFAYEDEP